MDTVGVALVVGGMAFLFSGLIFLSPFAGAVLRHKDLSKTIRSRLNNICERCIVNAAKLTIKARLPSKQKTAQRRSLRSLMMMLIRPSASRCSSAGTP
jgi:hypothetical protein